MSSAASASGRVVKGIVDGGGLYYSRLAAAGPYAFLAGVAADESGAIAAEARVEPPFTVSPPAHVVAQTTYIFNEYKRLLEELGSDANQFLQVEQHIPHKIYADGYLDVSRGKGFMDRGRPSSALLCTGDLAPTGAVINPSGIAVLPAEGFEKEIARSSEGYMESLTRPEHGQTYLEEGPFNEVVSAGPLVCTVGDIVMNWATGDIEEEAKVADYVWWGSEIRNEAEFLLTRLESYLARVDSGLDKVAHTTVYLTDIGDLYELDRVWRRRFPDDPPARTVVPCRGLGAPRWEGANRGHIDKGVKMEHLTKSIRPGFGVEKQLVGTGKRQLQHEAEAVRTGQLLWISGQFAMDNDGRLATPPDTASQLEFLFGRLEDLCAAGGTSLQNLVRLRAWLTDPSESYAVYAMLKQAVPADPPSVMVTGVPAPLQVPGATVILDGVAYIPD